MIKIRILLRRFLIWRIRHINDRTFIMILSVVVGVLTGFAAVVIKNIVHFVHDKIEVFLKEDVLNIYHVILPVIGILAAVLFSKYIVRRPIRHGVPNVLYAISKSYGKLNAHNMYSSVVASAFTVGFGGSVGLEGPTVSTGAAISSNLGRLLHLNYQQVTLLLGCACTGAMAAIFKAPVAAIVFSLEVIMLNLSMSALVPLLLASVSGVIISYLFMGQDVLYPFEVTNMFEVGDFAYYIVLGIICGIISLYASRIFMYISNLFVKVESLRKRLLIGSLFLGVLIFLLPPLFGEGYEITNRSLRGDYSFVFDYNLYERFHEYFWFVALFLALIIIFKMVAAAFTFAAGGVGGVFAPTLFMGANTGLLFALILSEVFGKSIVTSNFALMGMGGMIAGILHAPLTAIFLIADISGGYQLFVPLMITSTFSYATVKTFQPHSVYTYQLAKRDELITHDRDKAILSQMELSRLLEKDFVPVRTENTLEELVEAVKVSHRNIFPVLDDENNLKGIVKLDHFRNIMFDKDKYQKIKVSDIMMTPAYIVKHDDSMAEVARKFHVSGRYNFPVTENGKYIGFVSRASVFSSYRRRLKKFSSE